MKIIGLMCVWFAVVLFLSASWMGLQWLAWNGPDWIMADRNGDGDTCLGMGTVFSVLLLNGFAVTVAAVVSVRGENS